jgi:hypothetical protein
MLITNPFSTTGFGYVWGLVRPPLWSSGQSFWQLTQRSGFDSWRYQIFLVVGLERGPLIPCESK